MSCPSKSAKFNKFHNIVFNIQLLSFRIFSPPPKYNFKCRATYCPYIVPVQNVQLHKMVPFRSWVLCFTVYPCHVGGRGILWVRVAVSTTCEVINGYVKNDRYIHKQVALTPPVLPRGEEGVGGMKSELLAKFTYFYLTLLVFVLNSDVMGYVKVMSITCDVNSSRQWQQLWCGIMFICAVSRRVRRIAKSDY
jgi:hypothetical protein